MKVDLKDTIEKYKVTVVGYVGKKAFMPICVLCETRLNITWNAFWVNDEKKTLVAYFLCADCGKELCKSPYSRKASIIKNVIEPKIAALPHQKVSDLIKRGLRKVEF